MFVFGIVFIAVFLVATINIVRSAGKAQGAQNNGAGFKLQQAHDMHMQMHQQAHNMHMQMHQQAHDMHMNNTTFHM